MLVLFFLLDGFQEAIQGLDSHTQGSIKSIQDQQKFLTDAQASAGKAKR